MSIENLDKSKEKYQTVNALTEVTDEVVIPNGETWIITKMYGNAGFSDVTTSSIYFDTTLLFTTHGDFIKEEYTEVIGNGSKKIKISINNQSLIAQTMGAGYVSRKKI